LTKNNHKLNTSYGAIEAELASMGVEPTIQSIAKAVISIRQSKLPDPAEIGNSGSFFKNPVIPIEHYNQLKTQHPGLPGYDAGTGQKKVAAGWLIEQAGWKGKTFENYGVHKKQALVLVNYGGASGQAIYELSEAILQDVQSKFNITLEREVNIL
jgi:UDP-N-acetylmuramate dehydrogenase